MSDFGPDIPAASYLRAFDDPANRGVYVLEDWRLYVEPWPLGPSAELSSCEQGGRLGGIVRTRGEPVSMRKMHAEHGEVIAEAAAHFGMPVIWVAGMASIEAVGGHGMRWDSRSYRYEPRPDDFSGGFMQTMAATAEDERRKRFPTWPKITHGGQLPGGSGGSHPLFDHRISALLGTAYMATQRERYGDRPQEICGGYNAGRAKRSQENEFGIRTHGSNRFLKFCAFINDYAAVLDEVDDTAEV